MFIIGAQHGIHAGLPAFSLRFEPFKHIGIETDTRMRFRLSIRQDQSGMMPEIFPNILGRCIGAGFGVAALTFGAQFP